jgi:putative ABC transport system permease protein
MNSARSYLLTYQDYLQIRTQAPHVRNACPLLSRTDLHEVSEFANAETEILGVEPQLNEISYLPLKEGRWLNEMDNAQRRNVIVFGNELLKTLFPGRPAVGAFVLLNGLRFEVIGSMPHLGRGDNTWLNMRGYILQRTPFRSSCFDCTCLARDADFMSGLGYETKRELCQPKRTLSGAEINVKLTR